MPQFAANLSMMYPDMDFLDRFEAAAKDGFKAVEYLFPYAFDAKELAARLKNNGLQQVLFNLPPGGVDAKSIDEAWNNGTRGIACIPEGRKVFPKMTVEENLWLGAYLMDRKSAKQAADAVFDKYPRLAARRKDEAAEQAIVDRENDRDQAESDRRLALPLAWRRSIADAGITASRGGPA